jgi:hypothetical protein
MYVLSFLWGGREGLFAGIVCNGPQAAGLISVCSRHTSRGQGPQQCREARIAFRAQGFVKRLSRHTASRARSRRELAQHKRRHRWRERRLIARPFFGTIQATRGVERFRLNHLVLQLVCKRRRALYVACWRFFVSSAEQDDRYGSAPYETRPLSCSGIDAQFQHTAACGFGLSKEPSSHPHDPLSDVRGTLPVPAGIDQRTLPFISGSAMFQRTYKH